MYKSDFLNKKTGALILVLAATLSLAGCGKKKTDDVVQYNPETITTVNEIVVNTEAATEAATEAVTEAATEAPTEAATEAATEAPASEEGDYWFDSPRGARFYVPAGFKNTSTEDTAIKYVHSFYNESLDASIVVIDTMMSSMPTDFDGAYESDKSANVEVEQASLDYDVKQDDMYAISGVYPSGSLYYIKAKQVGDRYVSIKFEYPSSNKDSCDPIVESFTKNFEYE